MRFLACNRQRVNMLTKIKERKDVQAVMEVLRKRAATPLPEKMEVRMDNEEGQTWLGVVLWNSFTLVQDYPNFFVLLATVFIFGSLSMILQAVLASIPSSQTGLPPW